ncbi:MULTISPECIES: HAAAP family serine/threonine permease [unclassified Vibrio]|uniref:HAAAP family serine/threonine permease n=2 Tax=Vibrio TaxID=662 RepID=UPI00136185DE|nr:MULTISPECIES: HAAAP family serine/threonine permease [unclassified Vibrio]NAW60221.1 HAAAP family serine/threonine permease [Vibrio sp. V36_P2S2PM302]NAX27252.1 HAAAP family serine/threonine permease [Vibrio sp. V38_P2S17PM301]
MIMTKTGSDAPRVDSPAVWRSSDTAWMLGLYGTAIGAGVLFLPINAGIGGLMPLLMMAVLAFPLTYFSHRGLARFVLSGSQQSNDITEVVEEHFGARAGKLAALLYFISIFPILLVYGVSLTNTVESFMTHQMGMIAPPRVVLSVTLLAGVIGIVRFGEEIIVRVMGVLVYPFVAVLMLLAVYLIPHWNGELFSTSSIVASAASGKLGMTLWLAIPVMVFSFSHVPIISAFAKSKRKEYGPSLVDQKCCAILKRAHFMMVVTVMFFVFSCLLTLSPEHLLEAKQQNITILSYLANHLGTPLIGVAAPIIAFVAITKSFLGTYIGAKEGFVALVNRTPRIKNQPLKENQLNDLAALFILLSVWFVSTWNPSVLGMIEMISGPILSLILFLLPMYAIHKLPSLKKHRNKNSNTFVILIGIAALSSTLYSLI